MTWDPRPPATLPDNIRYLQAQINAIRSAPMGPVTVEGDEGSVTFLSGSGDVLFSASPQDVTVLYKGASTSLTPLLESMLSQADMDAERTARVNGDSNILSQLADERTVRSQGDANLRSEYTQLVSNERTARVGGDSNVLNWTISEFATKADQNDLANLARNVNDFESWARSAISELRVKVALSGGVTENTEAIGGGGFTTVSPAPPPPDVTST